MPKLIMLKGLPASGKSTRAAEIVKNGSYIRVNRDLIRTMLHFDKWSGRNEDLTVQMEKSIAASALSTGVNVVVDDTNLNPKNRTMWEDFATGFGVEFKVEEVKTPMWECVTRDLVRDKAVGRAVIVNMALQYGLYPPTEKGFVLCDLDGTLCDIEHRLKYAKGEEKDWGKFFSGLSEDVLRGTTLAILEEYRAAGHKIIFVSARPENYREATELWLRKNLPADFQWETLIMRKANDKREDSIVKQQVLDTYFKSYPVAMVIDDRPRVIAMWRKNGLNVTDVGPGIDF